MSRLDAARGAFADLLDPRKLAKYLLSGVTTGLVYVGLTLALNTFAGVRIEIAIGVSYVIAVTLHFALQRYFVFAHPEGFHIELHHQVFRYVVIGAIQLTITWSAVYFLPDRLGISEQVTYLATVAVLTIVSFVLLRLHVFHPAEDT